MIEVIHDLLNKKKQRYKEDYNEMLGDFKRELEIIEGYNGRQLLELLQNCDDQGAKKVLIELNIAEGVISISNDGASFSERGYRSLFIANLSPKTSRRNFIGNKGLGFRSVINWSSQIEIISNEISLKYHPNNLKTVYESLFNEDVRLQIAEEEGLKPSVIPMPFLAIPLIEKASKADSFSTTIRIRYFPHFITDILKQVDSITSDSLLFLKNIEQVTFAGFENKTAIYCKRELPVAVADKMKLHKIAFNDRQWMVFTTENDLPSHLNDKNKKELEAYQIAIAIEKDMAHSSPFLYSFFPTNIRLNQPYILHSTFDLDATRNQINDTEKNRFILTRIVQFTIEVAKYYSNQSVSYLPLKILHHQHKADTLEKFDYYSLIEKAIREEEIFPSLSNEYLTLKDSFFISNHFAKLLMEIGASDILGSHLKPTDDALILSTFQRYEIDSFLGVFHDYAGIIRSLSSLKLTAKQRGLLVKFVVQNFNNKSGIDKEFDLLIDETGSLIPSNEDTYTPPTNELSLRVPSFARIRFLENQFYDALIRCYKPEDYERRGKARFVYDILRDHCNIHSFEPITVAEKIIRVTNGLVENSSNLEEKKAFVREMILCLYHNYQALSDRSKLTIDNIPCITAANSINRIDQLHFSKFYERGKEVELLFEGIYDDEDYIASPEELGFDVAEPINLIESFLEWLGVNLYFKYKWKEEKSYYGYGVTFADKPFLYFTKKCKNDNGNYTGYNWKYWDIIDKEKVFSKLSLVKLVVLASIDKTLKRQLNNLDREDYVSFYYRYDQTITNSPSFLKYYLLSKYSLEGHLLDEKYYWVNSIDIDYQSELFIRYGLNKIRINEVLLNLGAVESLNELTIEHLTQAFEKLNEKFPNGANSQQFYKKALNHYEQHRKLLTRKVKLFARINDGLKLFAPGEIFFSDNNFLPPNLSSSYPILNFPLRGGAKKAIEFYQIQDLSDLNVKVLQFSPDVKIQAEFMPFFVSIQPYVLAYRLEDIQKNDIKEEQVLRLKSFKFVLCSEVICQIQEREFRLDEYNYIYDSPSKRYFINVPIHENLETLKTNPVFIDHFAEILCNVFSTQTEKQHFESLIRDTQAISVYNIKKLLGEHALDEANLLLGTLSNKRAFWTVVFKLMNKLAPDSDEQLQLSIAEFESAEDINYDDLNSVRSVNALKGLFKQNAIKLADFNQLSGNKVNAYAYNVQNLEWHLSKIEASLKQAIWEYLHNRKDEQEKLLEYFNRIDVVKNSFTDLRHEIEFEFDIDYSLVLKHLLEKSLSFLNLSDFPSEVCYLKHYKKNRARFSEDELVKIETNPLIHSLLFFENIEKVTSYLLESTNPNNLPSGKSTGTDKKQRPSLKYLKTYKTKSKATHSGKSSIYNPSSKNSDNRKVVGNKAEDIVYEKLVELYGELYVTHKSKENEWEHYDIKYSKDKGQSWIYVEVKSSHNNRFIITLFERLFGENHSSCYEIWVFRDGEIIILENFFNQNPILNPTEFEVIFEE